MSHVEPTREQIKALAALAQQAGPVEMINLLHFSASAHYAEGAGHAPCSGREAYGRYIAAVQPFLDRAGGRIVWHGLPQLMFIGPADRCWDEVLIVRYPDAAAFLAMVTDADYRRISVHRSAALEDSRLIVTRPAA